MEKEKRKILNLDELDELAAKLEVHLHQALRNIKPESAPQESGEKGH